MKKFVYSNSTKAFAVFLLILCSITAALTASNGLEKFCNDDECVYGFENSFSDATYFSHLLNEPEYIVYSVFVEEKNNLPDKSIQEIENQIEKELSDTIDSSKVNYFVKFNDTVFTNCDAINEKDLQSADFYSYVSYKETGVSERIEKPNYYDAGVINLLSNYDIPANITICTNIKADYVNECNIIWSAQKEIVSNTIYKVLAIIVFALLLLIYLIYVCGKNKDGEQKTIWIDNIWAEVHVAVIFISFIGFVADCALLIKNRFEPVVGSNLITPIICLLAALICVFFISSLLSIIRNIKCKRFLETSIIFRFVRKIIKILKIILKKILVSYRMVITDIMSKKTSRALTGVLFCYTALIGLLGILTTNSLIYLFLAVCIFVFAAFIIGYRLNDLDEIKKGVSEVRSGNISYKIPPLQSDDMKALANNINDIAKGLDKSVSAKVKAERMKSELITNVSHDLKTPITSIINYTELLSKIPDLPEDAQDYIKIISQKSERLKTLTQDLFDISKAQSGNENIVAEKLDVSLLINQSLGEHDSEIKKSDLTFCVNMQKELYILADGRKMSRVIGNLISNILKYTMKNTRVFISASENNDKIVLEFKNIASYPMDFTTDEIVGRFVRGDKSRTTEGNGLGLAIVKAYTEICGGEFKIITDGDMFKAILIFKKYI